jgi:membrane dipeptidase
MDNDDKETALRLHEKSIVIDTLEFTSDVTNLEGRYGDDIRASGITVANFTVPGTYDGPSEALKKISAWYGFLERHSDQYTLVTTTGDIKKAKKEGKVGILMGSQNATILGDNPSLLSIYSRLGLRIIQLSYYAQNLLGEGCGERTNGGLSNLGIEVVEEMNRLGMVIDVSHSGDRVTMDAIRHSKDPVVITHANPRALVNHIRNKTDEQIKALAEKGGVIGACGYSPLCEITKGVRPTLEDFLTIIDYLVKLVGPDHVGFGLDIGIWSKEEFDAWARRSPGLMIDYFARSIFTNKEGWDDVGRCPEVTEGLVARGYSDQNIEKILGLNFVRVFRDVWGE